MPTETYIFQIRAGRRQETHIQKYGVYRWYGALVRDFIQTETVAWNRKQINPVKHNTLIYEKSTYTPYTYKLVILLPPFGILHLNTAPG